MKKNNYMAGILAALTTVFSMQTSAVTIDAGDYTRLPDGTSLGVLYMQHTDGNDLYVKGDNAGIDADLDVNVSILRGVHFMDVGSMTIVPQFLLPIGEIKTGGDFSGVESSNGFGDLIIAPTFHFMQDPERKKSLAMTTWLYLPTGNYDRNKGINALGENRWKLALQLGYITPISEKLTLDLIGDVTFYGENDDYTPAGVSLKQDVSFEAQTHLRYHLSPTTYIAGMVSHTWGGETEVAGVDQGNKLSRTKALFTVGHFVAPTWQLLGSYGQDLSTDEGIAEDRRFNIRLLKIF